MPVGITKWFNGEIWRKNWQNLSKDETKKKLFIVFDAILGGVLGGLRSKQKKVLQNFSVIVHLETTRGPKAALN